MHRLIVGVSALFAFGLLSLPAAAEPEDTSSGEEQYTLAPGDPDYEALPDAPGKDEVFSYCSACHSLKLVMQQHLSWDRWDYLLVWMVEEQGMAPLEDDQRQLVLDYLAEHYGSKPEGETSSR